MNSNRSPPVGTDLDRRMPPAVFLAVMGPGRTLWLTALYSRNALSPRGSSSISVVLSPPMAKSPCPLSKTQFIEKAEPVKLVINGQELVADKRDFSTGSFGWYYNGKVTVTVDGKPLSVQVGLNLTVVGSKEAER